MDNYQQNNPLHGITLEKILTELVEYYGWEELGSRITINCFTHDPSIKSSLKFLRKTEWARKKVENLYVWHNLKQRKANYTASKLAGTIQYLISNIMQNVSKS